MSELDLYGPPGTGKTTRLTQIAMQSVQVVGPHRLGAVTYTRAAATELKLRLAASLGLRVPESPQAARRVLEANIPWVGTIHSLCYRLIGRPPLVSTKDVTEFARSIDPRSREIKLPTSPDDVEGYEYGDVQGQAEVELGLQLHAMARHRLVSMQEAATYLSDRARREINIDRLSYIAQRYEDFKRDTGKIDFEDMLALGSQMDLPVSVLLCDEVQDNCQPPGTKVLVTQGQGRAARLAEVPIERVRKNDRVVSYTRKGLRLTTSFVESNHSRNYNGYLIRVDTGDKTSRYTPEHRCVVKVLSAFRSKHVVYLMRRGNQYRVGVSSAYRDRASASTGIKGRMFEEKADAAWVLAVFDDRRDAYVTEELVTAQHAIPQIRFIEGGSPKALGKQHVDAFWRILGSNEAQAAACLKAYGRDIRFPLVDRKSYFLYNRAVIVRACNLVDGMALLDACEVLSRPGRRNHRVDPAWKPITVSREPYYGLVYSLDVLADHTYVADGLVTHNSGLLWSVIDAWAPPDGMTVMAGDPWQAIYLFSGASPELFRNRKGTWKTIGNSHRLSARTAEFALSLLRMAGYENDSLLSTWQGVGGKPKDSTTFFLARTNNLLIPVRYMLEERGEPYRLLRGIGPLQMKAAQAFRAYLKDDPESPSLSTAAFLAGALPEKGSTLPRGKASEWSRLSADTPNSVLSPQDRVYFELALKALPYRDYYERVFAKHGMAGFILTPKIAAGTIHAAKGREADEVTLVRSWGFLPGRRIYEGGRKEEACVAYVGSTRHRSKLSFIEGAPGISYPFPGWLGD